MKVKRIIAKDTREALRLVREAMGPDAVILSNKPHIDGGVELMVALDFQEPLLQHAKTVETTTVNHLSPPIASEKNTKPQKSITDFETGEEKAFKVLQGEVNSLKGLLQEQMSGLVWGTLKRKNPIHVTIMRRLTAAGFTSYVTKKILQTIEDTMSLEDAYEHAQNMLVASINNLDVDIINQGGVYAFLGSSGVGKTVTVAKLASQYVVKYNAQSVAIITSDVTRIGAFDTLKTYSKVLDVPFRVVEDARTLQEALTEFRTKKLILIDTPAYHTQEAFQEQLTMFRACGINIKYYLMLAATMQYCNMHQQLSTFQDIGLHGCILSKVDETLTLGEALSLLIEAQLPIRYISNGSRIPEDLHLVKAIQLIDKALLLAKKNKKEMSEEDLARLFTEVES